MLSDASRVIECDARVAIIADSKFIIGICHSCVTKDFLNDGVLIHLRC